jgi:hypothetical protein
LVQWRAWEIRLGSPGSASFFLLARAHPVYVSRPEHAACAKRKQDTAMNDLRLWRLLRENSVEPHEIIPLLRELAERPLVERCPFFGLLPPLLNDAREEVRAAAVTALRQASGHFAFRHLVRALHDPHPAVRLAAVAALAESAADDPPRYVHALFHADPEVRRWAVRGARFFPTAGWYALYLLPDPACAGPALERLAGQAVPAKMLPLLLDYLRRGVLPRATACRLLGNIPWQEFYPALAGLPARDPEQITTLLAEARAADGDARLRAAPADALDDYCCLFWDDGTRPADEEPSPGHGPFEKPIDSLLALPEQADRDRIVCALLVTAVRRRAWDARAVQACAVFHPDFLRFAWVPLAVRYAALHGFYAAGNRCPRIDQGRVRSLLTTDLCRRPSGSPDLWAIGGLLHLLDKEPLKRLQAWLGPETVVAAFVEDMKHAAPLLSLRDPSNRGTAYLVNAIRRVCPARNTLLTALLVHTVPADDLDALDDLGAQEAVHVFRELLVLAGRPGMRLTEARLRYAGDNLGRKIAAGPVDLFLRIWMAHDRPEENALAQQVLAVVARTLKAETLLRTALTLGPAELRKFVKAVAWCPGFPYGKEVQLAQGLAGHTDAEVRAWAAVRVPAGTTPVPRPRPAGRDGAPLAAATARKIATCDEGDLTAALKPCLQAPRSGLCAALARRPVPSRPNASVCLALLACLDPIEQVDEQFARFGSEDPDFLHQLDQRAVRTWLPENNLPLLGHAWLYRWEDHAFAFFARLTGHWPDGLPQALRFARSLSAPVLGRRMWEAVILLLAVWRWRDKPRFKEACDEPLGEVLVDALGSALADVAARTLVLLHEAAAAPELLHRLQPRVAALLPDLDEKVRRILRPWIDSRGLSAPPTLRRGPSESADAELLARIRAAVDWGQLEAWCRDGRGKVAEEAALRLLEFGEPGAARLAALLRQEPPPPRADVLADTVALWPAGHALDDLRAFVRDDGTRPELRFLTGVGLLRRGERDFLSAVLEAACRENGAAWFRPEDWQRLRDAGVPERQLALGLAVSPQPHAYGPAVRWLTDLPAFDAAGRDVLRAFLEAGTERMKDHRLRAAAWLHRHGDRSGFPLLLQNACEAERPRTPSLLAGVGEDLVEATVTAALTIGPRLFKEPLLLDLLAADGVDAEARQAAYTRLLLEAAADSVKTAVLSHLRQGLARARKLRRVAEAFAWGVKVGRELSGRVFAIEMIGGDDLGYTRLEENKLYINPLAMLRGDQNGQDTVEALILHELGHHLYHRGPEQQAVWEQAQHEGLGRLLNLVADEHLERNLRAHDTGFGDKLKRLGAYAFQHMSKELQVEELLGRLQGQAFEVLTATRLGAARRPGRVLVESGRLLLEMEKAGLSFARFVRALRMGLGNRHHDPEVAAALELFRGNFRKSSMADLLAVARRLREIFSWQTHLLDCVGQDAVLRPDPSELLSHGEGISNAEIEAEVQRVLEPRKGPRVEDPSRKARGGLWINVNPDEQFDTIPTVQPVPFDPAEHAAYAQKVARHAEQMRRYLCELGLALKEERLRVRGKSFDRTRIRALVTRGDPRMLIARSLQVRADLFLGVVIDCSGSMDYGGRIEKAKQFGTMLAEAAHGLRGVDVRLFGFTDSRIYDAGHAGRCAVHGLRAAGGNNDAAGLWHAAQAAHASRRRAKLLVMISDGLPTECSVAALRALVTRLTKKFKMCCAQVAVHRLTEVCFPHYVVLDDANPEVSVRRFGQVVARLVQRALRGG